MTTAANSILYPTLLDAAKSKNPDGTPAKIIEALTPRTPSLQYIPFREGNLENGHVTTTRTALPSMSSNWRAINEGIGIGKTTEAQATEACGMLESLSPVDAKLVEMNGPAFRQSRDVGHMLGMRKEIATGVFYHSTLATPKKFMGLAPRLNSTTGVAGGQIVQADSGASGSDQTSIWGVCWGESVYGIYPKGSHAGIKQEDLGRMLWDAADSTAAAPKKFLAYVSHFSWDIGLVVEDFRQLVRICNIDTSALVSDAASGADLFEAIIKAFYKVEDPLAGRFAWHCNRTVAMWLDLQARRGIANSTLSYVNIDGKQILHLKGYPVCVEDSITDAEDVVS